MDRTGSGRLRRQPAAAGPLPVAGAESAGGHRAAAVVGLGGDRPERGQAFSEFSRQVTYGQRTADDRLAFGARGGYRFGGKLRSDFSLDDEEVGLRRYLFGELFPLLKDARISHTWGGNLGMARRFRPHMLLDRASGIALSGGYGGEGSAPATSAAAPWPR